MDGLLLYLSIAGWILLILLCLLLLIFLLILILPARSRFSGTIRNGRAEGELRISWLLRFFTADFRVQPDGRMEGAVSLTGFRIVNLAWDLAAFLTESVKPAPRGSSLQEEAAEPEQVSAGNSMFDDTALYQGKKKEEPFRPAGEGMEAGNRSRVCPEESCGTDGSASPEAGCGTDGCADGEKSSAEAEKTCRTAGSSDRAESLSAAEESLGTAGMAAKAGSAAGRETAEPETGYGRLIRMLRKLYAFAGKLREEEQFRKTGVRLIRSLRRILRELLPRKGNGELIFGTGDGYETCRILGLLTLLWPMAGKMLEITPLLEEKTLEASFRGKGKLTPAVVLAELIRLMRDRGIRQIIEVWREE